MDYKLLAENIVKKALKLGADEAEVYLENERRFGLIVRNGDVETVNQATSKGLGLRVFKENKPGFSCTSDFSEQSLEEFIKKTVQLSFVAEPKPWNGLPDFKKGKIQDLDLYDPYISEIEYENKIKIAKDVERIALAYDKRIIKPDQGGYFSDSEKETIIVNSKGISYSSKSTEIRLRVEVIAEEGSDMQRGVWQSYKRHFKDLESIENVARKAGKNAVEKLGVRPVKTQKVPVVFDGYPSGPFWLGILWSMNGDSVYKKTTFLTEYLNKPITSELITISDDPTIPRHIYSVPFDGEGNITRKNILIDKGILKMFIYDTITARKAGVKVQTIARRNSRSRPSAYILNSVVQNGNVSREKIISEIKNGFYVKGLRGSGTDRTTGNFSTGASGFWIKDGEIALPVDGVTLGGNTLDILKNIEVVANDLDIKDYVNSPTFKVAEMTVGGKR